MTEPLFEPLGHYDAPTVARILFGRSAEWFWRHHERLYQGEGFPDPISHIGRPRWRGAKRVNNVSGCARRSASLDRIGVAIAARNPFA